MSSGTGLSFCLAQGEDQLWKTILWFLFPLSFPCRNHHLLNHFLELLLVLDLAASSQHDTLVSGLQSGTSSLLCTSRNCLPHAKRVERVQKEVGQNGHSISELPAMLKLLAQKQGGNHIHPLPQPWFIAVRAPASAIIWRKDPRRDQV